MARKSRSKCAEGRRRTLPDGGDGFSNAVVETVFAVPDLKDGAYEFCTSRANRAERRRCKIFGGNISNGKTDRHFDSDRCSKRAPNVRPSFASMC